MSTKRKRPHNMRPKGGRYTPPMDGSEQWSGLDRVPIKVTSGRRPTTTSESNASGVWLRHFLRRQSHRVTRFIRRNTTNK